MVAFALSTADAKRESRRRQLQEQVAELIDKIRATKGSYGLLCIQTVDEIEPIGHERDCAAKITHLFVENTDFRDERWACLKDFPNLSSLAVYESGHVDSLLAQFKDANSLRLLCLDETDVSTAGLRMIAAMPHLQTLKLSSCRSKPQPGPLCASRSIETVNLEGFRPRELLTDWLETLKQMSGLRKLSVTTGDLSAEDRKVLTDALPHCQVRFR